MELSAYDAAYLALAKRLNIGLATFDEQRSLAAQHEGMSLAV
jgi:predicted nucleic acid-binding protein